MIAIAVGTVVAVLTAVMTLLVLAGKEVVQKEYSWWGAQLAGGLLRMACRVVPARRREETRAEWLGELDVLHVGEGHAGVMFASTLVVAAARERGAAAANRGRATLRRLLTPLIGLVERTAPSGRVVVMINVAGLGVAMAAGMAPAADGIAYILTLLLGAIFGAALGTYTAIWFSVRVLDQRRLSRMVITDDDT
jgi:hypothetical protein